MTAGRSGAEEPDVPLRHERVQPGVVRPGRDGRDHLQVEAQSDGGRPAGVQQGVVESPAEPQPLPRERERHARHQDEVRARRINPGPGVRHRLRNAEGAGLQPAGVPHDVKVEPAGSRHAGQRDEDAGAPGGLEGRSGIGLAPDRRVRQQKTGAAERGEPDQPVGEPAAAPARHPAGLRPAAIADRLPHGAFRAQEFLRRHHASYSIPALLALAGLGLAGCLPLLIGNARTMSPGDLSLALAGSGRTTRLPAGIEQAGPAAGLVEFRGGLPPGRLEAGWTVQVPWTMMWDLKGQLLLEQPLVPALALRVDLGLVQPAYGAALLATKTFGPVMVTLTGGRSRIYERLWRTGKGPFTADSESYVKSVWAWGGGANWQISPIHHVFLEAVAWDPDHAKETPKSGRPWGVNESTSLAVTAGLRIRWHLAAPPARNAGSLTVLRGYVLTDPTSDAFEVGQPGIYRATVLLDTRTQYSADGKPAEASGLVRGRAVLIQGMAMPRPSTFLAHLIELQ